MRFRQEGLMMWRERFVAVTALAIGCGTVSAATSDFPNKPLRYIVATGPGGASDLLARTIAPALSEKFGVQVVVDNRAGAGNVVGAEIAARALPDGYTIFSCNIASLAVSPALYKKPGYDAERDFSMLGLIASNPNAISVNPSVAATTVAQFIALAKAQPGKLNYASAGIGTSPQLSFEILKMQAGINVVHVPYKGVGPGLIDLIGGRVQAMGSTVPAVLSSARSGKVRVLGVTSRQRDADLPDVPTLAESGMPDFEVVSWQGLCSQAQVPQPVLRRHRGALASILEAADIRKRIVDLGFQLHIMPADQFTAFARAERAKYAKVVKDIGLTPQ
jgi:tripartite-type tricarboxylate transporter receptor subunit TctC